MKTLCVAANNGENTDWTKQVEGWEIEVYTNYHPAGRETDTYLRYITVYYNELPEEVAFCHGYPFDHDPEFIPHLSDPGVRYYGMTEHCDANGMPRIEWAMLEAWCNVLGLTPQLRYHFVAGAQYRLTREQILSRSLDFYKAIYYLTKIPANTSAYLGTNMPTNPSAYALERLWPLIWNLNL